MCDGAGYQGRICPELDVKKIVDVFQTAKGEQLKTFLQKLLEESLSQGVQGMGLSEAEMPTVRIAVYDSLAVAPRIVDLTAPDYDEFIGLLAARAYQFSQEKGGRIPFTVIKEVIENLIHAYFKEAVVTILDDGNTIRISDQGPGIKDKEAAFQPGFTTATKEMKKCVRGVGSGLPIVKEALSGPGGSVTIEDNLSRGTVVTLKLPVPQKKEAGAASQKTETAEEELPFKLTPRQKKILFLLAEMGAIGPSRIASELNIGLSTAYRELVLLEQLDLVSTENNGKRSLKTKAINHLDAMLGA